MPDEIIKRKIESDVSITVNDNQRVGARLIQRLQENPEETGSRILHIAIGQVEKRFTEDILRQVRELVEHRNALFIALDKTDREIKLTDARLSAINAGEFKIGWNGKIQYTDSMLNFG